MDLNSLRRHGHQSEEKEPDRHEYRGENHSRERQAGARQAGRARGSLQRPLGLEARLSRPRPCPRARREGRLRRFLRWPGCRAVPLAALATAMVTFQPNVRKSRTSRSDSAEERGRTPQLRMEKSQREVSRLVARNFGTQRGPGAGAGAENESAGPTLYGDGGSPKTPPPVVEFWGVNQTCWGRGDAMTGTGCLLSADCGISPGSIRGMFVFP